MKGVEVTKGEAGCPDAEVLSAWVDGRLGGEEAIRVEAHVSSCDDCHVVMRETALDVGATRLGGQRERRPLPGVLRVLLPLAALLVLSVAGLRLWQGGGGADPYPPVVRPLVDAVGARRFFEARLTGGFAYGPLVSVHRGTPSPDGDWAVLGAGARLRSADSERSTPQTRRGVAAARLVLGDAEGAVEVLESLRRDSDPDAAVLADLAAALLVRAERAEQPDDYARSLEAASGALALDGTLREAQYNRALALRGLRLRDQEAEAWRRYLELDGESEWAESARQRLREIEATPASGDVRGDAPTEHFLGQVLLPAAAVSDPLGRAQALAAARAEARRLEEASGDAFAPEAVRALADRPGSRPTILAHHAFAGARGAYERGEWTVAREGFESAVRPLAEARSSLAVYAELFATLLEARSGDPEASIPRLESLQLEARRRRLRYVEGRVLWALGAAEWELGRPERAERRYAQALRIFHDGGEREAATFVEALLAGSLDELGDTREAWARRTGALGALHRVHRAAWRQGILYGAARWALAGGFPETALALARATLAEALRRDQAYEAAETRVMIARILAQVGRRDQALDELSEARQHVARVSDPRVKESLRVDEDEVSGSLANDPDAALGPLDRALELSEAVDRGRIPEIQLQRGRWLVRANREREAAEAFDAGVRALEAEPLPERWRTSRASRAWSIYEERLRLELVRGEPAGATLLAADAARARFFGPAGRPADPAVVQRVQSRLGARGVVLVYAVVPPDLHAWVITRDAVEHRPLPGSATDLERLVDALVLCLESRPEGCPPGLARGLHSILIAPCEDALAGRAQAAIVPQGPTSRVPWSLLRAGDGPFLSERVALVVAPTLETLASGPGEPTRPALERALFLAGSGAPEGRLPDLPGARREARKLAESVRGHLVSTGETEPERVLESMGDRSLIHFSGHALANETYPAYSALVLGPDPSGRPVRLVATRIAAQKWGVAPTVVLASCQGAASRSRGDEGVVHLARAFLVAGASHVVAHLWRLDDRAASDVMDAFYAGLAEGLTAPDALARAQNLCLRARGPAAAAAAAGFVAIGGWPSQWRT